MGSDIGPHRARLLSPGRRPYPEVNRMRMCIPLLLLGAFAAPAAEPAGTPNVIVMLADDLGSADVGCQGSKDVKTPNIDSLAANGVRCTAGYVTAPQCSPTRAGLMSGRYQQRSGHDTNYNFPQMLMRGGKTAADHLKAAGFATGHFGKWHLGFADAESAPKEFRDGKDQMLPTQHGFDESFGHTDYDIAAKQKGSGVPFAEHAHDDRVFARKAADFIQRNRAKPFFVYLAFHSPHTAYTDFGRYGSRFPDAPPDRVGILSGMARQDDAVGTVLEKLREHKLDTNTVIFYLSDNGGTRGADTLPEAKNYTGSLNTPLSGQKGSTREGGIRVPYLVQWKGHLAAGKCYSRPVSSLDVLPTALGAAGIVPSADLMLDGVNLLPHLTGMVAADPHEALFWRWRETQAVRVGDWKLQRDNRQGKWRLFDLSRDASEATDLAARHPERVKELRDRYDTWAATLPPVGPRYKAEKAGTPGGAAATPQVPNDVSVGVGGKPSNLPANRTDSRLAVVSFTPEKPDSVPVARRAPAMITVTVDNAAPARVKFAADEIRREARASGIKAGEDPTATEVVISLGKDPKANPQSYGIRVRQANGRRTVTVTGADASGAMYGGLDIAEAIRISQFDTLKDSDHTPHIAQRGIKFNIPLDLRTPSYTDPSDAAQANIPEMWGMDFWRETFDDMARHRYNVISLW
ncbi:MAG: sulfatase-like hydrolase/transferase, partial [Fimbriiglobus sp.]